MERSVFKRETIQLKYLPKVEKKNAQDKCKFYFLIYDDFSISIPRKTVKTNCQFEVNIETYNGEHNEAGLVYRIRSWRKSIETFSRTKTFKNRKIK